MAKIEKIKRCKASNSEFEEVWPGLKRCTVCGFTLATVDSDEMSDEPGKENKAKYPKEDTLHSTYHGKFFKARAQYGSSNVLDFVVLREKSEKIESNLLLIKKNDISESQKDFVNLFEDIQSCLKEIRQWTDEFKSETDPETVKVYNEVRDYVNKVRSLCRKGVKSNDIGEQRGVSEDIYLTYTALLNELRAYDMERRSTDIKPTIKLPIMCFTFNIDKKISELNKFMQIVPSKETKVEGILKDLYRIEFNRSLRLWDMCKPHPKFEDYVALLWNTPKFQNYIKPYMSEKQFEYYFNKYKANRMLHDYKFEEAPFYFGTVLETPYAKEKGIRDLAYTDRLMTDDDDDAIDESDMGKPDDVKTFAEAFLALGKKMNGNF